MANPESRKLVVDVEARITKLEKSMERAKRVANDNYQGIERRTGSMVRNVNAKLAGIGKEFAIGVGGGILAAMAPLALFHKAIDDLGSANSLKQLSDRLGISTDAIQSLQFGAQKIGVNIDQANDGLEQFAGLVAQAAAGGGSLYQIFKANNVQLKNADGTLRSTRDVLGDFANLIQNAATPAQQLFLAQQAFGDEASKMVGLFKNGAAGLDQLQSSAKDAGAVIDSDLIQKASELDQEWQTAWKHFDVNASSAILTAVTGIANLRKEMTDLGNSDVFKWLNGKLGVDANKQIAINGGKSSVVSNMLSGMDKFANSDKSAPTKPATVIPSQGGSTGSKSASTASSIDVAKRVIASLQRQRDLIGASKLEIAESNALWRAGADATDDQKKQIVSLVDAIYKADEAHKKMADEIRAASDAGREFTSTFIDDMIAGKDATDALGDALKSLGRRLENLALDQLFGGGGIGGGGLFGSLLGGLFGGGGGDPWAGLRFASGTNNAPGGMALVGERGPELVNLPRGSQVIPSPKTMSMLRAPQMPTIAPRASVSSHSTYNMNIAVTGVGDKELMANMAAGAHAIVQQAIAKNNRSELPRLVDKYKRNPRMR